MTRLRLLGIAIGGFVVASCTGDPVSRSEYPTVLERALQGVARTNLDSPNPTPAQLARRQRSVAFLRSKDLPYLESLPVVEDETTLRPRKADEIVRRCLSILVCAVKGETNDQALAAQLQRDFDIGQHLSPKERAFIDNPQPSQQDLVDYSWQYEAVHVLLWSLGYIPELAPPSEQASVPALVDIVKGRSASDLATKARIRPTAEILDMADLYYHLHWSAIELRLRGDSNPAVHEGTVRERHRALNWLSRYLNREWDDVTTDT